MFSFVSRAWILINIFSKSFVEYTTSESSRCLPVCRSVESKPWNETGRRYQDISLVIVHSTRAARLTQWKKPVEGFHIPTQHITVKHSKTVKLMNLMIRFHFEDVIFASPFQPVSGFMTHLLQGWHRLGAMVTLHTLQWSNLTLMHPRHFSNTIPNTPNASHVFVRHHIWPKVRKLYVWASQDGRGMWSSGESSKQIHPCACGMWLDFRHNQSIRSCPAACPHLSQRW